MSGSIIDLYSGCGGFSLGAAMAGLQSVAAIDKDDVLQSAYRKNFPKSKAIQADVTELTKTDWRHLIGNVKLDGIIGGPPCQGFSWIGKRDKSDPRNTLVGQYCRHIDMLRPKFFVMENVEGLIDKGNVDILNEALSLVPGHYRVFAPIVLSAGEFGVPTSRRRVFVVGYDPSEVDAFDEKALIEKATGTVVTVRDAIADLPSPHSREDESFDWACYPARSLKGVSAYAKSMRAAPPAGLGWREAVGRHASGSISGLKATRHNRDIAQRYALVPGGKCDPITKSYRLEWDGRCPSLRAGTGSEKGAFQAVRPLHPGKGRVITVREAARLQGFPDWFVFHPTKWHSFRMLGNSVSPIMAAAILGSISERLQLRLAA